MRLKILVLFKLNGVLWQIYGDCGGLVALYREFGQIFPKTVEVRRSNEQPPKVTLPFFVYKIGNYSTVPATKTQQIVNHLYFCAPVQTLFYA